MKKLVMVLLATALLFGLAGCAQEPAADPGEPDGGATGIVVGYEPAGEEITWVDSHTAEAGVWVKDFGDYRLVLITMGEKPSGGYAVEIDEAAAPEDSYVIDVRFVEPEPGSMVTTALTYPYTVVKVADDGCAISVRDVSGEEPVELEITAE